MTDTLTVASLLDSIVTGGGALLDTRGEIHEGSGLAASAVAEVEALHVAGVRQAALVGWRAAPTAESLLREVACMYLGAVAAPLPADQVAAEGASRLPLALDHAIGIAAGTPTQRPARRPNVAGVANAKFTSGTTGPRKLVGATTAHVEHTWRGLDAMLSLGPGDTVLAVLEPHVWLQRTLAMLALARGSRVVLMHQPQSPAGDTRSAPAHRCVRRSVRPGSAGRGRRLVPAAPRRTVGRAGAESRNGISLVRRRAPGGIRRSRDPRSRGVRDLGDRHDLKEQGRGEPHGDGWASIRRRRGFLIVHGEVHIRCAALPAAHYLDGAQIPGRIDATLHRTGDLGNLDEDGYLRLSGRVDDVLVLPSGHKIHPILLEDALTGPPVHDCAVFVAEGRLVVAAVPTRGSDTAAVRCAVTDRCRTLSRPTELTVVVLGADAQLPRTGSGKLQRGRLTDLVGGR